MDEVKYNKELDLWAILLGILQGTSTILIFFGGGISNIIAAVVGLMLITFFIFLSKKHSIIGPIIGIILGVLYILNKNLISIIFGIFLIKDSVRFMKYIKKGSV